MDSFWSCFLILIFIASIGINAVSSDGPCDHQCIVDRKCNFIHVHDRCFYIFLDQARSWHESRRHCQAQGLSMAKMDNKPLQENNYFSALINNLPNHLPYRRAWLGGRSFNFSSWSFANGTPVNNWQLNLWQGLNIDQQWTAKKQCGYFAPHVWNFQINIHDCDYEGYFLCRQNNCDVVSRHDCLRLVMERKPWFEARSQCIRLGGDLFDLKENEVLTSVLDRGSQIYSDISSIRDSIHVHIGIVHREWKWNSPQMDSESWNNDMRIFDTNWAPGEPNRYDQGCLAMYKDTGKWDDDICEYRKLTLCQKDMSTTTKISPTSTIKQTDIKLGQGGSTSLNDGQSTTTLSGSTAVTTASQGDPNTNLIVIILGSLLCLAVLIIATGYFCWKRGLLKSPHLENSNNTASSQEIPEEQSSATDIYHYISDDELSEKRAAPTVVYQNVCSHDKPGRNLHPPENGATEKGTPQDALPENNNYQHLIKR